jgi:hypothetical protein
VAFRQTPAPRLGPATQFPLTINHDRPEGV